MKARFFISILILVILVSIPSSPAGRAAAGWEPVAEGIDYQEFHLPGPNRAYVTRMDRSQGNLTLESSLAQGQLSAPLDGGYKTETVTSMFQRYDQSLNYWGEKWGGRSRVVSAINGFFFGTDGIPRQGQVLSGWYAKRFDDHEVGSGLAWRTDGSLFIGGCINHPPDKQRVIFAGDDYLTIDGVNVPLEAGELVVYTPQWSGWTPSTKYSQAAQVEVVLEMKSPAMILPVEQAASGVVKEIFPGGGGRPILFDQVVLSAQGSTADELKARVKVGDTVSVSQMVRNCPSSTNTENWTKTYTSIGGSFDFLKNGEIQTFTDLGANVRNPRTAVAYNDQYVFFIVVDGRNPGESVGMTMQELGEFARDTLGATWGINQDGGGSSTLVVNGKVKNNTYCNNYTCQAKIYLPLVVHTGPEAQMDPRFVIPEHIATPHNSLTVPPRDDPTRLPAPEQAEPDPAATPMPAPTEAASTAPEANQRAVANGLMMVVVEPQQQSTRFAPGTAVRTTEPANLRSGPGTNYPLIAAIPLDTTGVVQEHANHLNGVLATGHSWWLVEFRDASGQKIALGWVSEALLMPAG